MKRKLSSFSNFKKSILDRKTLTAIKGGFGACNCDCTTYKDGKFDSNVLCDAGCSTGTCDIDDVSSGGNEM